MVKCKPCDFYIPVHNTAVHISYHCHYYFYQQKTDSFLRSKVLRLPHRNNITASETQYVARVIFS